VAELDSYYDEDLLPPWAERFIVSGPRVILYDHNENPLKRQIGFLSSGRPAVNLRTEYKKKRRDNGRRIIRKGNDGAGRGD
jgi:hypothetical protein